MREFLWASLDLKPRSKIEDQIRELNGLPDGLAPLPFPRTSQIEGGLRELRCHSGRQPYRILYRRSENLFVLLHIVRKNSRAIPRRDIELARRRWRDYKNRMDAPNRRGPRPVGKDAP